MPPRVGRRIEAGGADRRTVTKEGVAGIAGGPRGGRREGVDQAKGWRRTMVSLRSGPVEMISTGALTTASIRWM